MNDNGSDGTELCPLCCNELNSEDERLFFPCPCNFQVCAFCFARIQDRDCPHCRTPYAKGNYRTLTPAEFAVQFPHRVRRQQAGKHTAARSSGMDILCATSIPRSELPHVRVLQTNLVYVTGVTNSLTTDELKSPLFFGRYGHITKLVAKPGQYTNRSTQALYITYTHKESAHECIISATDTYLGGHLLKCSFGTTKFCNAFLENRTCVNRECMFLHEVRPDQVVFTENDMSHKKRFNEQTHPRVPSNRITYAENQGQLNGLPPSWTKEQFKKSCANSTANVSVEARTRRVLPQELLNAFALKFSSLQIGMVPIMLPPAQMAQ
ncbi:putative Transcriptional repressor NOT4Hp [Giardia muris]|uniref:Putative Transcriptional repressor NOT4Hp n=1 Tax=Giardia muris TaxID=5742 RepID=A0A4Z1SSS1_GIAMU|nr:putative Transcriptional repressor NOT4Hp [Giardia muris]|eukprot:TNJ28820.1 putative Transcriptional repressor NOT4Hp [Giardia muris]